MPKLARAASTGGVTGETRPIAAGRDSPIADTQSGESGRSQRSCLAATRWRRQLLYFTSEGSSSRVRGHPWPGNKALSSLVRVLSARREQVPENLPKHDRLSAQPIRPIAARKSLLSRKKCIEVRIG
jgi:hypothetical protein